MSGGAAAAAEPARAAVSRSMLAASMMAAMVLEILARLSGATVLDVAAWCAMFCTVAAARPLLGLRETYLLTLCTALTVAILAMPSVPAAAIAVALDQAAFLLAFILLLGLLHEAAATSPSVAACGTFLTRQPPGRRYYALYSGAGVMAVLFNIGVVSFLVPLIQRGIASATPGDRLNSVRERRQVSALLRGFAWSVIWSPTAVAPLVVVELIPGIDRQRWIAVGVMLYLAIMVLGALEDRLRFRAFRPAARREPAPFPLHAALMFLLACAWLFAMALAVVWLTGDSVVFGLMVACPAMLVGWIAVQTLGPSGPGAGQMRARLSQIALTNLPKAAPVAVTLACSGYVGRATAALIPAEALSRGLGLDAMPDFVLLSLLPVALSILSLLALSPIMMAVFFGSVFGSLNELPADPTLIALSISCGWALSMTFSPFATVVLLIDRVGDIRPTTLTWRWNLVFSLLAALALVPVFAMLTGGG